MPQTLREALNTVWELGYVPQTLPDAIADNLNPALPLRPYQREALLRLLYYLDGYPKRQRPTQLLFHMATGSGKTLVMAAAMLHLYQQGYRRFLFFVNSVNIIEKTRDNFLNPLSAKYLFAPALQIEHKPVRVREVDNFQAGHPDDLNILFTTIQGLHTRLNAPRENSLTADDFADGRVVLISDEAHHINALTKAGVGQSEMEDLNTWEATVNRIFTARADNVLLEFTATVELDHPAVREKYADKILYEYTLRQFREDGYSKEVRVLEADLPPIERALQAAVLSQYRRKVAEKHGLPLKPVVLFKSRTIAESRQHAAEFAEAIQQLGAGRLEALQTASSGVIRQAFDYFAAQGVALDDLAAELRQDFGAPRCLSVNSKEESEAKQLQVNSLEDRDNEICAIFVVDMLNEGWDVLNLFDIVRLYNTRDAKRGVPGRTTISEAQLIGRGARYYPFGYGDQPRDQRKFDRDLGHELRALETLYYHSAHNPRYIDELHTALVQTGIVPETTRTAAVRVKDAFKQTDLWRTGAIFVNRRIANPRENIWGLDRAVIEQRYRYALLTGQSEEASLIDEPVVEGQGVQTITRTIRLYDLGPNVLRTALQRLPFYQFANLKRYLPHLSSINEFITSPDYLRRVAVDVYGAQGQVEALSQEQKLAIALDTLDKIGAAIESGSADYVGTRVFEPLGIRYCVQDKTLQITVAPGGEQERGVAMSQTTNPELRLNLADQAWYVYDENYGTSEEKRLVRFIHGRMSALRQRFAEVYLIRNEKLFTLYSFDDGQAVEPDFVLLAVERGTGQSVIYQVFIEPKGEHLIAQDRWKQTFLLQIAEQHRIETLLESKRYRLLGLPFYNESLTKMQFETAFHQSLLEK